jgi:RNA polymerase sigma factor (sigma-70 family)
MKEYLENNSKVEILSEETLWQKFIEGDETALSKIFLSNYDSLYGYATRLISNSEEAKDLIQDLFLKLWNNRKSLGRCNHIKFYLLQSVRHLVIDRYKKKTTPISVELHENTLPSELPFDSVLIENQNYEIKIQKLKKSFDQLSKRQQEAIYLRYYQQIDYPAISEIMAVNIQSARNLVHSAIQQLKRQMGNITVLFMTLIKK